MNTASLDEVLKTIEKACGKGIIQLGVKVQDVQRLPLPARSITRSWYGGIPFGRIVEFSGAEHSGKTTTALLAIGNYQKLPNAKKSVYIDVEGSYDAIWAAKMGVDNSKIVLMKPETQTAEEICQWVLDMVATGEIGIVVLDSIPAMVPQNESERLMGQLTMGGIAAPLTTFTRKIGRILNKQPNTIFIGINQLRDNMTAYGAPTKTVGGRMWKHGASLRVEFRSYNIDANYKKQSNSSECIEGACIQSYVVKNKTAPRDIKVGEYFILFHSGFSERKDIFNYALNENIVVQSGSSYTYVTSDGEIYKAKGKVNFLKEILKNVWEDLVTAVDKQINEVCKVTWDDSLIDVDEEDIEDSADE